MNIELLAQIPQREIVHTGVSLGSTLAIVCSWDRNRSIIWAIIAGVLSWFYVIYFALTRNADDRTPRG